MPRKIIIVRHGETDWNRERAMQGQKDLPLNWQGFLQAKESAKKLQHEVFDAIFTSDSKRAHQTAMVITAFHINEIVTTPLLRERSFGELEGISFSSHLKLFPWLGQRDTFFVKVHDTGWIHREFNIETDEEIEKRIKKFKAEYLQKFKNKNVLLVSHAGLIEILMIMLGVDFEFVKGKRIMNAEILVLVKKGERYRLEEMKDK